MINLDVKIALEIFFISLSIFLVIGVANIYTNITAFSVNVVIFFSSTVLTYIFLKLLYKGNSFQVGPYYL